MQELSFVHQLDTWLMITLVFHHDTSGYPPKRIIPIEVFKAVRAVHVYTLGRDSGSVTIRRYIKPNPDICRALGIDLRSALRH
jgi:hypothetical protein